MHTSEMARKFAVLDGTLVYTRSYAPANEHEDDFWAVETLYPWYSGEGIVVHVEASRLRLATAKELAAVRQSNHDKKVHSDVPVLSHDQLYQKRFIMSQNPPPKYIKRAAVPFPLLADIAADAADAAALNNASSPDYDSDADSELE
jgi:hypothetical protein